MPQGSIWQWAAPWIFGAMGIVLTLVIQWRIRRGARRVVCREVARTTLVRVEKEAGDEISVRFANRRVRHLAQLEAELRNSGPDEIRDVDITVRFPEGTKVLKTVRRVLPENEDYTIGLTEIAPNAVKLHLPYLNSGRLHDQVVELAFVCDGSIDKVQYTGGGEGWSVRSQAVPTLEAKKIAARRAMAVGLVLCASALPIFVHSARLWGRASESEGSTPELAAEVNDLEKRGVPSGAPEWREIGLRRDKLVAQREKYQAESTASMVIAILVASVGIAAILRYPEILSGPAYAPSRDRASDRASKPRRSSQLRRESKTEPPPAGEGDPQ